MHLGCSSYTTVSWKSLFYPESLPRTKWFDYYSSQFNTYELNSTFYKFPTVKTLSNWYNKAPERFIFSIKAPKTITHIHKFENCSEEISKFYEVSREGLRDKLGCVLFQLPPSFSYSEERLVRIINSLDTKFKNVVEFRNASWWREDVFKVFKLHNIIFCSVNFPNLPTTILDCTKIGYVRLHGNPNLFYSEYSKNEIETIYNNIKDKGFSDIYIYFNNTASTAGIINALELKKIS